MCIFLCLVYLVRANVMHKAGLTRAGTGKGREREQEREGNGNGKGTGTGSRLNVG